MAFNKCGDMPSLEDDFLGEIEVHSVDGLRAVFDAGLDPNAPIRGRTPFDWLTEMYTRTDRFADCVRLLLEAERRLRIPRSNRIVG